MIQFWNLLIFFSTKTMSQTGVLSTTFSWWASTSPSWSLLSTASVSMLQMSSNFAAIAHKSAGRSRNNRAVMTVNRAKQRLRSQKQVRLLNLSYATSLQMFRHFLQLDQISICHRYHAENKVSLESRKKQKKSAVGVVTVVTLEVLLRFRVGCSSQEAGSVLVRNESSLGQRAAPFQATWCGSTQLHCPRLSHPGPQRRGEFTFNCVFFSVSIVNLLIFKSIKSIKFKPYWLLDFRWSSGAGFLRAWPIWSMTVCSGAESISTTATNCNFYMFLAFQVRVTNLPR